MLWNVPPDVLPGSATVPYVLDRLLNGCIAIFELSAIDLMGEPLLVSTVEQFLGLWNVN